MGATRGLYGRVSGRSLWLAKHNNHQEESPTSHAQREVCFELE